MRRLALRRRGRRRCWLALAPRAPAAAHPLGNFSVNHLTVVRISDDRVDVRYVLDQAEMPTFRERGHERSGGARRASGPRSRARLDR